MTGIDYVLIDDRSGVIMKTIMNWFIGAILVFGVLAVGVALMPKGQPRVGLVSGHLRPCPDSPNCVNSEGESTASTISPWQFDDTPAHAWQRARHAIESSGGRIQKEGPDYLWATFTTRWLRFVDDVELVMDAEHHLIQVRSASRVGYSDFGVNRARVEKLRQSFNRVPPD